MSAPRICKDRRFEWDAHSLAPPDKPRPAPYPGPRCATHERARRSTAKASAHERHVMKTYGLQSGEYKRILALQGGACYLCQRAKGTTKKLAVDHDHACCPETPTCGRCNRGLLRGPCDKLMGHARDDIAFFRRGEQYLTLPPARVVIWERGPDG